MISLPAQETPCGLLMWHYIIRRVREPDTRAGSTRVSNTLVSRVGKKIVSCSVTMKSF